MNSSDEAQDRPTRTRPTAASIHDYYAEAAISLTANPDTWRAFLVAAGRNYKLPFDEQVLVFAQRPDAQAVMELKGWNERFERWVNKGAYGIAVFGEPNTRSLRYYFDITDTHTSFYSRPVPLWEMRDKYKDRVMETLYSSFDVPENEHDLARALTTAAHTLTLDNAKDYLEDLEHMAKGSDLSYMSTLELSQHFEQIASDSVAFELCTRLNEDVATTKQDIPFAGLSLFNTIETVNILGCAVSDIAQGALREIARTVLNIKYPRDEINRRLAETAVRTDNSGHESKEQTREDGVDHGNHLPTDRRASSAESGIAGRGDGVSGSIRTNETALSEESPQGALHQSALPGTAEPTSARDEQSSRGDDGDFERSHDQSAGHRRTDEAERPDEVGGTDEQHPKRSTRGSTERDHLPLEPLPSKQEQIDLINEADEIFSSASLVSGYQANRNKPTKAQPIKSNTPALAEQGALDFSENFVITDDNLGVAGFAEKVRWNMDALACLNTIEQEDRPATPSEQLTLSKYVGWGALSKVFDESDGRWATERTVLQTQLGSQDYERARASTLNAHYTSPTVIKAIYEALETMGFSTGNVLEPACGIGNFFGLMPKSMENAHLFGTEIDPLTARIASKLYPRADIRNSGFEDAQFSDNFFDVAIGNVPFGSYSVADKRYDEHRFLIHDYFFAHTLDLVRPGGIIAFITSKGTLDKKNPQTRRYLAERAELIGAIRLPNTAFEANAGTKVTADIVFLQKRDQAVVCEPDWVHLGVSENNITLNSYFAEHPDMVLGTMTHNNVQFYGRGDETTCEPFEDTNLEELLRGAIGNMYAHLTEYERDEADIDEEYLPADPNVKNYSYTVAHEKVYFRIDSRMILADTTKTGANRIKGMVEIRDTLRELINQQTDDAPDAEIERCQKRLGGLYDSYTSKYGLLNSRANSAAFAQDSAYALLCALENLDEEGNLLSKADMFTKRTIRPYVSVTSAETSAEALAASLSEKGCVDIGYMTALTNNDEQEIAQELQGVIFLDPTTNSYKSADEYLSGNVREKLTIAREYARSNEVYGANVKALEQVIPADIPASEISVRLGATWIPTNDIQDFMVELLETPRWRQHEICVRYSPVTAQWSISGKSRDNTNELAIATYGTHRANAYRIIEDTLNLRDVRIVDYIEDAEGKRKPVLNKKETAIALSKQDAIKEAFKNWIFDDPERRTRLVRTYNDTYNSMRLRTFDGSHLTFPGMNPEIRFRPHQVDAVARILYGGNTLLAHEVGAGKTYVVAAATQELKRIGLANKSLIVVPNHLTEQWASEYLRLYPAANILVATKRDFERKNRRRFCARIATGDYDAIIIGHTQFEKIPVSIERQQEMIQREIAEITSGIEEIKVQRGERYSIKQMEASRKKLEVRLKRLNDQERKDDVIEFEQLGIDRLFVDESHYYKNLFFYTKMRNVGGIPQTEAQKSSDLFMKCRYLNEITGGKGIVFATGTPISNSMVELYTVQRYLQYDELSRLKLQHFDCWASTFGETVTAIELAPEGTGYRQKTRFAKFYNLPELMTLFRQVADIQTADMLNLPVPRVNYHNISVEPSKFQRELVEDLSNRADRVRNNMVDPTQDNMLLITNDGRKLALDQRLVSPELPDDEHGKTATCAANVYELWKKHQEKRLTQLLFCDLSTPKSDGTFSVYNDIRDKLIAKGVPESEIAFIHNYSTEAKKAELFAKVRSGQVRILLGSTQKMGAGTNVQARLIALHDLDCPWRPSDLQQRLGRIERQGNLNDEVEVFRYVTENTFDAYLYQLVESKQRFIGQIMTSKSPVRAAADVDETALSYAELKALATGNPLIKEHMDLEVEVSRLKLLKSDHLSQKYALEDKLAQVYPQKAAALTERIKGHEADVETLKANPPAEKENFRMVVDGAAYTDKTKAGQAVLDFTKTLTSPEPVVLGNYRGFTLKVGFDSVFRQFEVSIVGALTHKTALGTDGAGSIVRIDNAIARIVQELDTAKQSLADTEKQIENAKREATKPFDKEEDLKDKTQRLAALDKELNLDKTDEAQLVDDEQNEPAQRKEIEMQR